MVQTGEDVEFQALEEKIESLIRYVGSLKREKEELADRVRIQEEKIANLNGEIERLTLGRDKAKQRIISVLEKIEKLGI